MTTKDFFAMFQVPFLYGGPWDDKADAGPEPVVVLSKESNQKAFGGVNSVGKTVNWHDREFRVARLGEGRACFENAQRFLRVVDGADDGSVFNG